jgi:hypothetical protein
MFCDIASAAPLEALKLRTYMECNLPNHSFSDAEWQRIEAKCVSKRHLSPTEDLRAQISQDAAIIHSLGLTLDQLADFILKIRLHYNAAEPCALSKKSSGNPRAAFLRILFWQFYAGGLQ